MRYALLLQYPEMKDEISQEDLAAGMRAFDEYAKALDAAGVLQSAEVLQPSGMTTTVSVRDGERRVQDGPFADTKEQMGGTFVLEVADLDEAIEWAARAPSVGWGAVEIRPVGTRFVDGRWQGSESS
jgi:hypothetical protein